MCVCVWCGCVGGVGCVCVCVVWVCGGCGVCVCVKPNSLDGAWFEATKQATNISDVPRLFFNPQSQYTNLPPLCT